MKRKYNPHLCIRCQLELKVERSEHCEECFNSLVMKDFREGFENNEKQEDCS